MKWKFILFACFTFFISTNQNAQVLERFSSNQIPKLNLVVVEMSESIQAAEKVYTEFFKGMMRMDLNFDFYVDPTYKKLKDQKAIDISLFGESASGKKFESEVDTKLELKANLQTFIVLDRQRKVRAFSQVSTIDESDFTRVVEELLLNIDGEEKITVDSEEPETAYGWQTSLGKENYEKENKGKLVIDFGAGENYWYKFLGEELPDFNLKRRDGTDISFKDLHNNNVTVLFIYAASEDEQAMYFASGIAIGLMYTESLYRSFVLGEAEPGDEKVENVVFH